MLNFDDINTCINSYQKIAIFRHCHPDCDAFGSQFGMKFYLQENYPDKQIKVLGEETCNQGEWPSLDVVEDEWLSGALALVLDTANAERIDDQRYQLCDKVIKIDHHPNREPFGDMNLVLEDYAATCEILGTFFTMDASKKMTKQIAECLYKGLLTDTLCYKTSNTTSHTLETGAKLASYGIDIPALNRELFDVELHEFKFRAWLQDHVQIYEDKIAYLILDKETLSKWNMTPSQARNFVSAFGSVKEFEAWCLFTEQLDTEEQLFAGSLRSKLVQINDIAEQFNGGGHKNASGVKNLTQNDIQEILKLISSKVHE